MPDNLKLLLGPNKASAKIKVRSLLQGDKLEALLPLIKLHPGGKGIGVISISYEFRPPFLQTKTLIVHYDNGTENTISWVKCIDKLYSKSKTVRNYNNEIKLSALRHAIYDTKRLDFIMSNGMESGNMHGRCASCGQYSNNVEIDHASTPFGEIVKLFALNFPNLFPLRIIKHGYQLVIGDDNTRHTWVAFHDTRADFQILCAPCNNKKSNKLSNLSLNSLIK